MYRKVVGKAVANQDGSLEVLFRDGPELRVPPHPKYEAWEFNGPMGMMIVSLGGRLAIWGPQTRPDS